MQIKSAKKTKWSDHPIVRLVLRLKKSIVLLALLFLIVLSGVSLSSIYYGIHLNRIKKADSFKIFLDNAIKSRMNIIPNYIKGVFFANPQRILIDIKHKHFQKLAYKRQVALDKGILLSHDDDYVPAQIRYGDKTVKIKMRLKGDWTDHLLGEKWSFRIKVRGDNTLFGMKQLSIHHPKTRNFIHEWIMHKALKREGILALRYDFVEVSLNGKDLGVYALEEHFEKRLVEHNGYREGPILKFNENLLWADKVENDSKGDLNPTGLYSQFAANLDVFKENTILQDPVLLKQFSTAHSLLEAFRYRQLQAHKVFDIKKLAGFFAISDLLGASHSLIWHNLRFYYNPVTSLLEPIGFDANAGKQTVHVLGSNRSFDAAPNKFKDLVFSDVVFMNEYIRALERVTANNYLEELFAEVDADLEEKLKIIYRDFPYFHFTKKVFYENQKTIRNVLSPVKGLHAYFIESDSDRLKLEVGNIQAMPIEVLGVTLKDSVDLNPRSQTVLPAISTTSPADYINLDFNLPEGFAWTDTLKKHLKINYRILGSQRIRQDLVFSWPRTVANFIHDDVMRQAPNIKAFDFLVLDEKAKTISIKPGLWQIDRNMILPPDYRVICGDNTRLDLIKNATIISRSAFDFKGSEESPILIISSDSTGQGIAVLNAGESSNIEFVSFHNLSSPDKKTWGLTGAVTFYESPVNISYTQFSSNRSEDALNIIRTDFAIDRSLFDHTKSDAFDADFANGKISETRFINLGNDAIDISGSIVAVENVHINRAGDKGLSAGEGSRMTTTRVSIMNSEIAVASKDRSEIFADGIEISNCKVGITLFQKKPEFDAAFLAAKNMEMKSTSIPYLVEERSRLVVDGANIGTNRQNVEAVLYGIEYGKSSKTVQ